MVHHVYPKPSLPATTFLAASLALPHFLRHAMQLLHATTLNALEIIVRDGLPARSRWTCDDDVLRCLEGAIVAAGEEPITLTLTLADLREVGDKHLMPDTQAIYDPFTAALGLSEEAVEQGWEHSVKDWVASLNLVWSIRFERPIPAAMLSMIVAGRDGEPPRLMPICVRKRRPKVPGISDSAWRERETDRKPPGAKGAVMLDESEIQPAAPIPS